MFDRLTCDAVLGANQGPAMKKFQKFYEELDSRGWSTLLCCIREILSKHNYEPLLAERTIDKFLMLSGTPHYKFLIICNDLDDFKNTLNKSHNIDFDIVNNDISECLKRSSLIFAGKPSLATLSPHQNYKFKLLTEQISNA